MHVLHSRFRNLGQVWALTRGLLGKKPNDQEARLMHVVLHSTPYDLHSSQGRQRSDIAQVLVELMATFPMRFDVRLGHASQVTSTKQFPKFRLLSTLQHSGRVVIGIKQERKQKHDQRQWENNTHDLW
jgi:hypothetical protein